MDSPVAELPLSVAARPVAAGATDRAPRRDDVACWFDIGARNGILQTQVRAPQPSAAARAIRKMLLRGIAAGGTADARALADAGYPEAALNRKPARSTIPGTTTFKALCNSYLRKLLRGAPPDSLYWVAHATLPDGDHVFARLRLTFIVEDLCVEKNAVTEPVAVPRRSHEHPVERPDPYSLQTEWIRELG